LRARFRRALGVFTGKYAKLVVLGLVFLAGLVVVVVDGITEYTWIYPLNRPREVTALYAKSSTSIALINAETGERNLVVLSGVLTSSVLSECSTCYAVVLASGVNFYTLLFTLILVVLTGLVVYTESRIKPLVVVVLALFTLAIVAMYLYVRAGETAGYNVVNYYDLITQDKLSYKGFQRVVLVEGSRYKILQGGFHAYSDYAGELSLISIRVRYRASDAIILVNTSRGVLEVQNSTTLYATGRVELLVLPGREGFNVTVEYYRLEFAEKTTQAPLYFTITLLSVIAQCTLVTVRSARVLKRRH
jgi:hypothetical protein